MTRLRTLLVASLALLSACSASPTRHAAAGPAATAPPPTLALPTTTEAPKTPVTIDADVAALPPGAGHPIAIVVDDVGLADTFLDGYLALRVPVTFAVMPMAPNAATDDQRIRAAGRDVILHIPLARTPGDRVPGGIRPGATTAAIDTYLAQALQRVPDAIGANNHEGAYGPTDAATMQTLLAALQARGLFFLDSVTTQRTVAFRTALRIGIPPRINNVFLDHFETDADSRRALLDLARIAATSGAAIGICHVFHPYEMHALQTVAAQLEARGYVFAPLSRVTNAPAPNGLDRGVRL